MVIKQDQLKDGTLLLNLQKKYVVGQLCVDSNIPVYLFSDEKFDTENEAKKGQLN